MNSCLKAKKNNAYIDEKYQKLPAVRGKDTVIQGLVCKSTDVVCTHEEVWRLIRMFYDFELIDCENSEIEKNMEDKPLV